MTFNEWLLSRRGSLMSAFNEVQIWLDAQADRSLEQHVKELAQRFREQSDGLRKNLEMDG